MSFPAPTITQVPILSQEGTLHMESAGAVKAQQSFLPSLLLITLRFPKHLIAWKVRVVTEARRIVTTFLSLTNPNS